MHLDENGPAIRDRAGHVPAGEQAILDVQLSVANRHRRLGWLVAGENEMVNGVQFASGMTLKRKRHSKQQVGDAARAQGFLAVPVPGPDAPVATLPSDATDTHHNRTCVTQFAAGLARGPHAVVVGAGVDNNFSGAAVGITVRSATAVIRVYR